MSADRRGGWLRCLFRSVRRRFEGVLDGGTAVSAVADPSPGMVQLQLAVWEQRL